MMEKKEKLRIGGKVAQLRVKSGLSVGKQGCTACTGPADAVGNGVQRCKYPGKTGWLWESCKLKQ
jgi:hypothetical protein